MSEPMKKSDPAYWLLEEGLSGKRKIKVAEVYNPTCYICTDPEFALMGLPLCYKCYLCGAHVPADDMICDNGHNQEDDPRFLEQEEEQEISFVEKESKLIGDQIIEEIIQEKKKDLEDFLKMFE